MADIDYSVIDGIMQARFGPRHGTSHYDKQARKSPEAAQWAMRLQEHANSEPRLNDFTQGGGSSPDAWRRFQEARQMWEKEGELLDRQQQQWRQNYIKNEQRQAEDARRRMWESGRQGLFKSPSVRSTTTADNYGTKAEYDAERMMKKIGVVGRQPDQVQTSWYGWGPNPNKGELAALGYPSVWNTPPGAEGKYAGGPAVPSYMNESMNRNAPTNPYAGFGVTDAEFANMGEDDKRNFMASISKR